MATRWAKIRIAGRSVAPRRSLLKAISARAISARGVLPWICSLQATSDRGDVCPGRPLPEAILERPRSTPCRHSIMDAIRQRRLREAGQWRHELVHKSRRPPPPPAGGGAGGG